MHLSDTYLGDLLVASTVVPDGIYNRAVALLLYQDQQNVVGVMLNRPMQPADAAIAGPATPSNSRLITDSTLPREDSASTQDASPPGLMLSVDSTDPLAGQIIQTGALHFGGPIIGPLIAVHGVNDAEGPQARPCIEVAADREQLAELIDHHAGDPSLRLIVGHLGWSHEQLGAEIDAGIWHRLPATPEVLQSDDQSMWPRLIRRATASSLARWVGTADHPPAPWLN